MTYHDDYDWEDPHEDYCDHDEYDIDILTGHCECSRCPGSWYATDDQIRQEMQRQATYYEDMEREERRQWWLDKTYPVRMLFFRILARIWPRKACSVLDDDEIPF